MIDNTKIFEKNSKPFGDLRTTWDTNEFEIKPEHLKLMQRFCIEWQDDEFGAPEVDPKRPYGNSGVHQDMLEIFGLEEIEKGTYKFKLFDKEYFLIGEDEYNINLYGPDEKKLISVLDKLHTETKTALQICLSLQSFEPGVYKWHEYHSDYIKIR